MPEPVSYDPMDDQYSDQYYDLIRKRSTDIHTFVDACYAEYDLTDKQLHERQVI